MSVDSELLALLYAVPNLNVYDGHVEVDETTKVITVPLPYVVYGSSSGRDNSERFAKQVGGEVNDFYLTGIGSTREQAKWVLDRAKSAVNRKRLGRHLIRRYDNSQPIRRDDDYTRPGGDPIFYGVDQYGVSS